MSKDFAFMAPDERMTAYRYLALKSGLSGSSNKAAISTLLMQCPLLGEPIRAENVCNWGAKLPFDGHHKIIQNRA